MVLVDRTLGNEDDLSLLDGVELRRQVARRPARGAARRGGARARDRRCGRRSSSATGCCPSTRFVGVTGTNGKTTTSELLGAIFRAAGRDVAVAGNVGTPLTSRRAARTGSSASCRRSSSRTCTSSPATSRCCSTSSRTTSTATARSRRTATRSCASSSARARRSCRAGSGLDGIEFSADDPLPAEPLIRGAHNRENAAAATAAARAAGIDDDADRRGAAHLPGRAAPARARRRARRRPLRQRLEGDERRRRAAARSRRTPDEPVHLILGGSLEGRGLRAARGGDRRRTSARST